MGRKRVLPKGVRRKGGTYEARATISKIPIYAYGKDLDLLLKEFEYKKEQARNRVDYRKNGITLNEWFDEWFEEVKAHKVKPTSIYPMRNRFTRTFGFYIGDMKVCEIKPLHVQKALNAMELNGVAHSSMRDALGRLRECMEFAVANEMIHSNPCIVIQVPWTDKRSKEEIALTQDEQNMFLSGVEDSWYKEMFYFLCLTGVRVGELGALRWEDINFNKKIIHIKHSLSISYVDGVKRMELVSPKTVNSYRRIPFIGEMEEILKSQKQKQEKLKRQLKKRWRGTGPFRNLVFTTGMGSPCTRYIVEQQVKKNIKKIREKEAEACVRENRLPREFPDIHPHTLRHTFATRCFENRMEPKVVQKLLGHSSISITLNIYTHVMDDLMEEEIAKFGKAKTMNLYDDSKVEIPEIKMTAKSHY